MQVLLIDIGSTYTKGTLIHIEEAVVLAQASALTTVETSVLIGVEKMLDALAQKLGRDPTWDKALLCSSAAGGLKMVAIGLGRKLTAEAAGRSALGAGARILKTYAYELSDADIAEIDALQADIILLSGGTDRGNRINMPQNAEMLTRLKRKLPIVIAGNNQVADKTAKILRDFPVTVTENVMPQVNVIHPDPARRVIRQIFMERITVAKGLDALKAHFGPVIMPTPDAVLQAAKLLADGYQNEPGRGKLLVVDIGGATTDIHSIGSGLPHKNTITIRDREQELRVVGLEEPREKRTVEGDLGMRYSALSLFETVGEETLRSIYPADYRTACRERRENIRMIPQSPVDKRIDEAMARAAATTALARHVGKLSRDFNNGRYIYYLEGKDLSDFRTIIGTGGVVVHSASPGHILRPVSHPLYPRQVQIYIDKDYLLSAMGLLATEEPDVALKILKKDLSPAHESRGSTTHEKQ